MMDLRRGLEVLQPIELQLGPGQSYTTNPLLHLLILISCVTSWLPHLHPQNLRPGLSFTCIDSLGLPNADPSFKDHTQGR